MEFPPLLEGVARQWFNNLPTPAISCYDDLRTSFLLNFHNMRATRRTHVECHDIKHERGESLGQFIDRYCQEVARIPNCTESLKLYGFIHGICRERHVMLWQRLRKRPPETLAEALREAHEHMRAEEDTTRYSSYKGSGNGRRDGYDSPRGGRPSGGFRRSQHDSSPYRHHSNIHHNDRKHQRNHQGNNNNQQHHRNRDNDTRDNKQALIRSLTKILKEIYVTEPISKTFEKPKRMSEYVRRDKSKFCDFHDDFGHETNHCKALVDKVVPCLKHGDLKHLKPGKDESGGYKKEAEGMEKDKVIYDLSWEKKEVEKEPLLPYENLKAHLPHEPIFEI
ncbi:uncharacterized protein [Rutidosis leptorrhynchoides]|uniref:uncharacterized protein n=1 Tax=Rutidosis leptorrhynchoides TaxID=125765 RepID=UPI003A9A0136